MGVLTAELTLPADTSGEAAAVEFRQTSPGDATQLITVMSVNYAETGSYTVNLPEGTYDVVATYGGAVLTTTAVSTGSTVTIDFTTS